MSEKSIVVSLNFKGELPQILSISFFDSYFRQEFKKEIQYLNFTISDKTNNNWKQKSKSLKFTSSNLKKYEKILSNKNCKIDVSFELLRNLDPYIYKSKDIDFSVTLNQFDSPINSLNIVLNSSFYSGVVLRDFVQLVSNLLIRNNCDLVYGFVFCLSNSKGPSFYIEGIGYPKIKKDESEKLKNWLNNKSSCESKIWDIFWGNVVSSKHLKIIPNALKKLNEILGGSNVVMLNNDLLWFNINDNILEFEILEYGVERKRLYNLFKEEDMLISSPQE
jgi:hypothetical protein